MAEEKQRLLIVDDSEIDRAVLDSILYEDFKTTCVDNGYTALEIMHREKNSLAAVLLDVSMPVIDGFSVLRLMKENKVDNIPVFLISAEATKENVERAIQLGVIEFIKKPFNREVILRRLKTKLGISDERDVMDVTETDIAAMNSYITRLEKMNKSYCANFRRDYEHYRRMKDLMKILLKKYSIVTKNAKLNQELIEIISDAASFSNIGFLLVPNKINMDENDGMGNELFQLHTRYGADLIHLNSSKHCEYFVQICADMCLHHHEKYDGTGFPDRLYKDDISIYTQMCRLVGEFDTLFFKYHEHNEMQFDFVIGKLDHDKGGVSPELFSMFTDCRTSVVMYYNARTED